MGTRPGRSTRHRGSWRIYLKALGPGLISGASDDDPSGIGTYAQTGAQFQYSLVWTSILTLPLMAGIQEICDRTALATGENLGELAARKFPRGRSVLLPLLGALIAANLLNITADVVAVGEGMHLLGAGSQAVWTLAAGAVITIILLLGSFALIARVFKFLALALLTYVAVMFAAPVGWSVVLRSFVPHVEFTKAYMLLLVAILGTTISPYLFFWQSAHRIEDLRRDPDGGDAPRPITRRARPRARMKQRTSRLDVFAGMTFSNLVMFSIIVATGATIGANGSRAITSAAQAAEALQPIAGGFSEALFALGFIGSGMLAIPVLAGAGAAGMAGLLHRRWGFSRSIHRAPVFYGLVMLGTGGGTLLSLIGVDPIQLLVYSALINGLLAPPFLALVMLIAEDRSIMSEYANGRAAHILGWLTMLLMTGAALTFLVLTFGPMLGRR